MLKADALAYFGSPSAIAEAANITVQAVSQWGELVPEGTAYKLESISKGKLKVKASLYAKGSARAQALAAHLTP